MPEAPFDVAKAHRWFAAEFNNRAWELVESPARSAAEAAEMISAAHAAAVHWRAVGTPVNVVRAEYLLATAYAAAGLGQPAVLHADACLRLSEKVGDEQSDFDRAALQGAAAIAYAAAGDGAKAEEHYQKLAKVAAKIANAEERALLSKLYPPPKR